MGGEKGEPGSGGSEGDCVLGLPLGESSESFNLEEAVCSHGLFMMSPNLWDPCSRSLSRPLRIPSSSDHHHDDDGDIDDAPFSVMVRISHPRAPSLRIVVSGVPSLSPIQRRSLLAQVSRMLRLSHFDGRNLGEFRERAKALEEEKGCIASFSGRVFRSPTLFEDMVKCILLCNCQWPRTLSMARSLCELQWELYHGSFAGADGGAAEPKAFVPETPPPKDFGIKKYIRSTKVSTALVDDSAASKTDLAHDQSISGDVRPIGNFPSPRELANLDESFLARRCNLGYRAGRIRKLAQGIVEGKIKLRRLVEASKEPSSSDYEELLEQLRQIDGFGPFTCANVLMCMGFYHVIPTDSETIRHLKQVHNITASIQTVQKIVETFYEKYSPFQFLAYWAEVWHFYGQRFGVLSEMPSTEYKLITSSKMRSKGCRRTKKIKAS